MTARRKNIVFGKRLDGVRGRRGEPRTQVMFPGCATTVTWSKTVLVMDLCTKGARLKGDHLPRCGANILLKIGETETLGLVHWQRTDECGLRFYEPLSSETVRQIENEGRWAVAGHLTADERLAIAHWAPRTAADTVTGREFLPRLRNSVRGNAA